MPGNSIYYKYIFEFENGARKVCETNIDLDTMEMQIDPCQVYPVWTLLSNCKCPNCPLDADKKYCPVAVSLDELVVVFNDCASYEQVKVTVESEERTCFARLPMQRGLSSLVGIRMVGSGCPVMSKLKPMLRFHLPFATEEETMYRALSMYLFAQYFIYKRGGTPDLDMDDLVSAYNDIREVNRGIGKRLANIKMEDSNINALVSLDCFADAVSFSINKNMFAEIESLFKSFY